jgi:hypothetical protein
MPTPGVAYNISPSRTQQHEPGIAAAAAYSAEDMRERCIDWLAEIACPGSTPEHLLASFKQFEVRATMHSFIAHDPALTPMLRTSRGTFMPDKAVSDTGCIPSIISEGQAKRLGYYIHRYKEGENAKVVNIEGAPAERFIGYTEPVSVVFGCGTADEVEVRLNEGFLVLGNPAVESMYTCVLGRGCLDKVSGCVIPFLQTFMYMPRLQEGITTVATMPVRIGRLAQAGGAASPAAVAAELPLFACGAFAGDTLFSNSTGQGTDEEDTTGQDTGTSSSSEVLHFFKPQPLEDEYYSMVPPQQATWEPVMPQFAPVSAAMIAPTVGADNSSGSCESSNRPHPAAQQQPAKPPDISRDAGSETLKPKGTAATGQHAAHLCSLQVDSQQRCVAAVTVANDVVRMHGQYSEQNCSEAHDLPV